MISQGKGCWSWSKMDEKQMLIPVEEHVKADNNSSPQHQCCTNPYYSSRLLKPPFARCSITDQEISKNHPQYTNKTRIIMTSCMAFLILSTWRGHAELFKHQNTSSTRWPTVGIGTQQNISWKKDHKPGHPVLFKLHEDKNGKDKHLSPRRAAAGNLENRKSSSEPNETT